MRRHGLLALVFVASGAPAICPTASAEPASGVAALLAAAVRPGPQQPSFAAIPTPSSRQRDARPEGVAQTSIERRFASERVTGSLGFLCGRPDNLSGSGGATVFGTDPHGRFVGARLSIALR